MESNFINYNDVSFQDADIVSIVRKLFTKLFTKLCAEHGLTFGFRKPVQEQSGEMFFKLMTFKEVEKRITDELPLVLSRNRRTEVIRYTKPIFLQLKKCFDLEEKEYYSLYNHSEPGGSLVWTPNGTIDKMLTLKRLILDENREKDYIFMFQLSCKYCYKEYMLRLWEKIPSESQRSMYYNANEYVDYLIIYWINKLRKEFPDHFESLFESRPLLQPRVELIIYHKNLSAFKYFWRTEQPNIDALPNLVHYSSQQCNSKIQRDKRLMRFEYQETDECADILFFTLSNLKNPEQQRQCFEAFSEPILTSLFSYWPYCNYFLPTINVMWDYLNKYHFIKILSDIASRVIERAKLMYFIGKNMPEGILLQEVWRNSPNRLKKFFILHNSKTNIKPIVFRALFQVDLGHTVIQLTQDVSDKEPEKIELHVDLMSKIAVIDPNNIATIWRNGAQHFKNHFVTFNLRNEVILKKLLEVEDEEILIQGFESCSTEKKKAINITDVVLVLISLNRFEFIQKLAHRYFDSEEELNKFRVQFVNEQFPEILEEVSKKLEIPDSFKIFLDFFCDTGNEEYCAICPGYVIEIVKRGYYNLATRIVASCNSNVVDMKPLMKEIMLSSTVINFFLQFLQQPHKENENENTHWREMKNILKWLHNSKESVDDLKNILEFCFCETTWSDQQKASEKMRVLFNYLDIFCEDDLECDNCISDEVYNDNELSDKEYEN